MEHEFLVLVLLGGILFAGCVTTSPTDTATTEPPETTNPADPSPAATTTTRESNNTCRSLDYRNQPAMPEELTRQTALQFVKTYRNVTLWNEKLVIEGKRAEMAHVSVTGYVVNETATGYVVHIEATGGARYGCSPEYIHSDLGLHITDFFVNESVLALLHVPLNKHTPSGVNDHAPVTRNVRLQNWTVLKRWNESSR